MLISAAVQNYWGAQKTTHFSGNVIPYFYLQKKILILKNLVFE